MPRLRIGTFIFSGYEPLFLARSLGKLDEKRVQLLEFPSSAEALLAFKNEAIDGLTTTLDDVLRLAQASHEPRVVLMIDYSNGADVILAKRGIDDIEGLRGKRVGVETNALGTFMLARALETKGMKFEDVQLISLRVDGIEGAFQQGDVDAAVTYGPFSSRLIARGARLIFDSTALKGEIADALIFRRKIIEPQRKNIALTLEGWFSALDFLRENPKAATERIAPREGLTAAQFAEALKLLHLYTREENRALLAGESVELNARLRKMAAFLEAQKLMPAGVEATGLLDGSFLR